MKTHHDPIRHAPRFFDLLQIFFDVPLVCAGADAKPLAFFETHGAEAIFGDGIRAHPRARIAEILAPLARRIETQRRTQTAQLLKAALIDDIAQAVTQRVDARASRGVGSLRAGNRMAGHGSGSGN